MPEFDFQPLVRLDEAPASEEQDEGLVRVQRVSQCRETLAG